MNKRKFIRSCHKGCIYSKLWNWPIRNSSSTMIVTSQWSTLLNLSHRKIKNHRISIIPIGRVPFTLATPALKLPEAVAFNISSDISKEATARTKVIKRIIDEIDRMLPIFTFTYLNNLIKGEISCDGLEISNWKWVD